MATTVQAPRMTSSRFRKYAFVLLVVSGLYLLGVSPVRSYLDQREEMQMYQEKERTLAKANEELQARVAELQTDAEIERIARDRYELVPQGRAAFAVMPPPTTTASPAKSSEKK